MLEGARDIIVAVEDSAQTCVVHGSDGWDRTSQLTALAELCLDPYYRTYEGFIVLIEKEWLSFGHKFKDRYCGAKMDERSPIFFQFLDCVRILLEQHPTVFEFNEWFLLMLLDHQLSGLFGTFMFNNVKERILECQPMKMVSLWSYMCHSHHRTQFVNPFYEPGPDVHPSSRWSSGETTSRAGRSTQQEGNREILSATRLAANNI